MNTITQDPPRIKVKEVKVQYDRNNDRELYAVIKSVFPCPAKQWTIEMVFPFMAEGADADKVLLRMKNHEYNLNNPKRKPRRRSRCNLPRKDFNYAEEVTKRITTAALFAQEVK